MDRFARLNIDAFDECFDDEPGLFCIPIESFPRSLNDPLHIDITQIES